MAVLKKIHLVVQTDHYVVNICCHFNNCDDDDDDNGNSSGNKN
jgi:hypothetical protein